MKKSNQKFSLCLKVLSAAVFSLSLCAQASVTYSYSGNTYTYFGNTITDTHAYSNHNSVTFSFTVEQMLTSESPIATPSTWVLSDGVQTYSSASGHTLSYFQLTLSSTPGLPFDNWYIHSYGPPCPNCFNAIQTRNEGTGLTGDWSQNALFNYGGNWDAPGQWTVTSVPMLGAVWLFGFGLIGLVIHTRKQKSINSTVGYAPRTFLEFD